VTTAVLFDLDQTLVQYDPERRGIFERTCERLDVETDDERFAFGHERFAHHHRRLDGDPSVAAARDLRDAYDLDLDPDAFARTYREVELEAAAVPSPVRETVAALAADHPLAVVTNGYGPRQRVKLSALGLAPHFDALVSPETVAAFKPAPAIFEAAQQRVPADRHVFVGDSPVADVQPAAELGFDTVLVGGGGGDMSGADSMTAGDVQPDLRVETPAEFGRIRRLVEGE